MGGIGGGLVAEVEVMIYRGRVEDGVIRLEGSATLPEGAEVEVQLVEEAPGRDDSETTASLYERLKDFVGQVEGLPPDASVNLDHYLYGLPKRE
jgi:hypothetical protein